ncbi:glycerol channel [Actinomortierella ambigua]|nr:glycerol channel [Actinomortierella ambigua]
MSHREPRETDALLERGNRDENVMYQAAGHWASVRHKLRKAFAEFLGTAILLAIGSGAVAQLVFSKNNTYGGMCFAWGVGVIAGIYVSGGISGGHLNPAVTLASAIFRDFDWKDVPIYWASQFLGAFFGAAVTYLANMNQLQNTPKDQTAGIFVTALQNDTISTAQGFFVEFVGTAILLIVVFATSDKGNAPAGLLQPLIVGLTIYAIGTSFGYQTGFALNPARDLGPRFFIAITGWGFQVFSKQAFYFWVPIIAPFAGALGGAFLYDLFVYASGPSPLHYYQ